MTCTVSAERELTAAHPNSTRVVASVWAEVAASSWTRLPHAWVCMQKTKPCFPPATSPGLGCAFKPDGIVYVEAPPPRGAAWAGWSLRA